MEWLFTITFLFMYPILWIWSLFIRPNLGKVIIKFLFLCWMFFGAGFIMAMFIDSTPPLWAYLSSFSILIFALFVSFKW